jgi:hypothetical protein
VREILDVQETGCPVVCDDFAAPSFENQARVKGSVAVEVSGAVIEWYSAPRPILRFFGEELGPLNLPIEVGFDISHVH